MPSTVRLPAGIVGPLAMGLAFYGAAAGALALTQGANGIAVLWPPNGILLAALLIAPAGMASRYAAAATLASFAANLGSGVGWIEAAGFTVANVGEALLAWRLVAGRNGALPSFVAVPQVARYFLAVWAATLTSATFATLFELSQAVAEWSSWVTTDLLGLLIVTPTIVTAAAFVRERRGDLPVAIGQATMVCAGVAATAVATFGQDTFPLLFLPVVAVLFATLRLGPFGAAASVAVIAAIGATFTFVGHGPLWLAVPGGSVERVLYFQFYLLVLLATSLPLGALFAARDALVRRLAERNRLLHLAERSAGLGHWWLSASLEGSYFSPEVLRIHGVEDSEAPALLELLAGYHDGDRDRVEAILRAALAGGPGFTYEARILTAAGEERRVHSTGTVDRAADGTILGIIGTLQDVTRQVQDQHALEAARSAAEQAARLAIAAAETDPLTGVANRRKIAALLDVAIAAAHARGHPLSVAILDLDHFKTVNDRFGHLVGDQVLVRVARVAAGSLRGADVVGRMGGEEFILLLPTASADQASAIAERVRLAIAARDGDAALPHVTASLGVATLAPGEDAAALLHRADCALYEAKRAGRNALRRAA